MHKLSHNTKVNIQNELVAMQQHIAARWRVGSDLLEMLQEMYKTVQTYGPYWYSWQCVADWASKTCDERNAILENQWGKKHASGLGYIDIPLQYSQVLLSQTRNFERELDEHNVQAYRHRYLGDQRYREFQQKYIWLEDSTPIDIFLPKADNDERVEKDVESFEGHTITYATRPGFVEAIDVEYIQTYAGEKASQELCAAIMIHLESIHRHNQAVELIKVWQAMGIDNKSPYPIFEMDLQTDHPLVQIITEIILNRRNFVLQDLHRPEVKNIIAQFLNDPENSKPIFQELLPYVDITKSERWNMENLIPLLDEKYAEYKEKQSMHP